MGFELELYAFVAIIHHKHNNPQLSECFNYIYCVIVHIMRLASQYYTQGKCRTVASYDPETGVPVKKTDTAVSKDLVRRFPLYSEKLKRRNTDLSRRKYV